MDTIIIVQETTENTIFSGILTIITALVSFVLAVWNLLWKGSGSFKLPEDITTSARGILITMISIYVVFIAVKMNTENVQSYENNIIATVIIAFIAYLLYNAIFNAYSFTTPIAAEDGKRMTRSSSFFGGLWVSALAKKDIQKEGLTGPQELLENGVDKKRIWSPWAIEVVKAIITLLYVVIIYSTIIALSTSGFYLQTIITEKSPLETIQNSFEPPEKTIDQ
ncbi:hypothetical protein [Spongiimicrobium salis]|uniref:hypothetical protein n=1 Tax=Spongiimicrobium salis TaxID=1667022 RepID=UPI00374DAE7B